MKRLSLITYYIIYLTVSSSEKKIAIVAALLALFTSFAVVCIDQTAMPVDADPGVQVDLDINLELGSVGAGGTYVPQDTISLPDLGAGEYAVIDGARAGGMIIISSYDEFETSLWGPLFSISGSNKGTYYFQNLIMETGGTAAIEVGESNGDGGTVVVKDVSFTTYYSHTISAYSGILEVESCYFEEGIDSLVYSHITFFGEKLTLKDSFMYGSNGIMAHTKGEVSVGNCYFECESTSMSLMPEEADISIADCTFVGSYDSYSVEIFLMDAEENRVELTRSLFRGKEPRTAHSGSPALYVGGDGSGTVTIEECCFTGLTAMTGPIVNLESVNAFLISDTTFHNNATGQDKYEMGGTMEGKPVLSILGIDAEGRIVNSTFMDNLVTNETNGAGCVRLNLYGNSETDLIHNTFFENYHQYEALNWDSVVPASLEIIEGSVNMVNNILVCQHGAGSTVWDDGGNISAFLGNIDKADPDVAGPSGTVLVRMESGNKGDKTAGCDLSGESPKKIMTIDIVPVGEAGGRGAAGTGFDMPNSDQRGKTRSGPPDIGAVSTSSTFFIGNGGGWYLYYPSHYYSEEEPYWFTDLSETYARLAVAEDRDGKILLPSGDLAYMSMFGANRLLGWSTEYNAELPEPMFVDFFGAILGEFSVGATYYAVWGEEFVVMFIPGNGKVSELKAWVPGGSVETPAYGTVNGMSLTKWTYDPEGTAEWDPALPLDGNMILYGQWGTIQSADAKIEFNNGGQTDTRYVPLGGRVPKPADPVREGYAFKGWFTASEGGVQWDFNSQVAGDMVLYAQWEETASPIFFTVTFDPCNGSAVFTAQVQAGQRASAPQAPAFRDYVFRGWFSAAEGGTQWNFSTQVTGDTMLYAHWGDAGIGDEDGFGTDDGLIIAATVLASLFATLGVIPMAAAGVSNIATQASIANVFQQGMQGEMVVDTTGEEKNRRMVVFDPKNGRSSWASSVFLGRLVDRPGDPRAPKGMRFSHWSEAPDGPPFDFMTPVTKVLHLFAVYVDNGKNKM